MKRKLIIINKLKRAYYYLFYTFYKWYEAGSFVSASDWKASLSILVLQIWILFSLVVYYKTFFDRYLNIEFNREDAYLIVFPFVIIDYIVFNYIRLSYKNSGVGAEIVEEHHYYPFGLSHEGYNFMREDINYHYKN